MTIAKPTFHSPIATPQTPSPDAVPAAALRVSDQSGVAVVLIQGQAGDVLRNRFGTAPSQPGDVTAIDGGFLAQLTPAEFYLFGASPEATLPAAAELDAEFDAAGLFAHATDLSHGKAVLELSGRAAAEALSKICGLDFHDTIFPSMQVKQSSAAKIKTLIARCDEAGTPVYYLHVDRPFGQYFWDILWDAGQEFGIVSL